MIDCGSLEYAQARLQARHGQSPTEADWRHIEVVRGYGPLLEAARVTALRPWLVGITPETPPHALEAILRGHWRALVAEARGWMPVAWQAAVQWCSVLPELAPLQHLARGGAVPPWMHDDALWRDIGAAEPALRKAALATGPLAPLQPAWANPAEVSAVWLAEWRQRLPQPPGDADDALPQVLATLQRHAERFAQASTEQGWGLRGTLHARLVLLLRRAALQPAALFIHLALRALELERLRAELLRRALFPRAGGA